MVLCLGYASWILFLFQCSKGKTISFLLICTITLALCYGKSLKFETFRKSPINSMRSYCPFDCIRRVLPFITPNKTDLPLIITFLPLTSSEKLAFLIVRGEKFFA